MENMGMVLALAGAALASILAGIGSAIGVGKAGQAAAVSVIGFLILCVCAGIYMVLSLRAEKEDA